MGKTKKITYLSIIFLIILGMACYAATGTVKTGGQALRMREKASTSSEILEQIETGTTVEILEKNNGWYKIKYNEKEGYAYAEYIVEGQEEKIESNAATGKIEVYIMPLITSSVINTIDNNENIQIQKQLNDWAYITNGTVTGWVRVFVLNGGQVQEEVTGENETQIEQVPEKKPENEEIVEKPKTEEQKPEEKPEEEKPVIDVSNVTDKPEETEEREAAIKKGYIKVDSATLRKEATTKSEVVTYLLKGTGVTILAETENWYKVQYYEYTGYMAKTLISQDL